MDSPSFERPEDVLRSDSANVKGLLMKITSEVSVGGPTQAPYADRKMFVICMTPRSGSTYLGSILDKNGIARVNEHFRIHGGRLERDAAKLSRKTFEDYARDKIDSLTSAQGYFGLKADWPQYVALYASGLHAHYFKDASFFYLTRSDILAQAISRFVATESNYFHSDQGKPETPPDVAFDYGKIREHLNYLVKMQGDWESFFACEGIVPHRISYEEVAEQPAEVVQRIAAVLGTRIENPGTDTAFQIVRTELNERLREQFVAEHRKKVAALTWL